MAADQLRISIGAAQNRRLFPANFMAERLPGMPGFADLDAAPLFARLSELWDRERGGLPDANEAQTEERFIRPCLRALGFEYTVQADLRFARHRRQPDYALFLDESARRAADDQEGRARYVGAVAVLDAKRFDRPLDTSIDRGALSGDPVAQIIHYIQATRCPWGILTNGRFWRLYALEGDLVEPACYEVDLVALLEGGDASSFRHFAAFFSAEAMRPDASGTSFLDRALADGTANARELGAELQGQVFAAVPMIAAGLLGEEERTPEALDLAFENSLVFLYRLLFCLHAEARGLLPVDEPHYFPYSVREQKERLASEIRDGRRFSSVGDELFNELRALFRMIDGGDARLGVNEYDGGLFSAERHPYFEGRLVTDDLLSRALDGLYRIDGEFIDYRSLSVRHLGTIYEWLLEFRLVDADGDLQLEHSEGRRDSGSYFTPEPIVDLIVERTLEPVLERRSAEIAEQRLEGDEALAAFLELKIVDPAMGSGHFLVSASSYIADFIATDPSFEGSLDRSEIRRLVAERCLYGVDLNPMAVELARLSLWLTTVTGHEPLTFLANLREGNSLVGADLDELMASETVFGASLAREAHELLDRVTEIAALPSTTGELVHEKERIALAAATLRDPLERFADMQIEEHFSEPVGRSFHWQIEFPEVFLTEAGELREDGGFDAVLGNPPYIRIQSLGRELANYCRDRFETAVGSFDAYIVFIELAAGLLNPQGRLGFITPNKFMKLEAGSRLRELCANRHLVEEIVDFGDVQVFAGATNYTAIVILDRAGSQVLKYSRPDSTTGTDQIKRAVDEAETAEYQPEQLGGAPWIMATGDEAEVLAAAKTDSTTLEAVTDRIFQGLITSADQIYILEDRGEADGGRRVWCRADESEHVLEPDLLHPLASGSDVDRFAFHRLRSLLLFPYRRVDGEMELIDEEGLERLPRTRAFLHSHEASLRGRERGGMDHDGWWGYTRIQNLGLHDSPKLGVAATVRRLEVAADPLGRVYFHNVRVNGIATDEEMPIWPLLALMNSRLVDFVFRRGAAVHANGYFAANKQFIAPLPMRIPGGAHRPALTSLGERLHERAAAIHAERDGFRSWLGGVLGTNPGGLPGRGAILAYDVGEFDGWLDALRAGAGGLDANVAGRAFRDQAETEWRLSVARLTELKRDQAAEEIELDRLVYDLYELPERLVRVVDAEYA